MHTMKHALRVLVTGSLLVMFGFIAGAILVPAGIGAAFDGSLEVGRMQIGSELINETERVFSEVYNRTAPGVVSIIVSTRSNNSFTESAIGSGFVIDTQGHIVTNFHVVEGADRIEVNMYDGTITRAELIGRDADSDLAVIKINIPMERLRPIPLADSEKLSVGQTVLAIGSPFSNDWTLTSGIISALNRSIIGLNNYSIGGVIQTDAAINPGNSGGPLINLAGEVIGVNSQIESGLRQNAGIGFSVPSNLVRRVAKELIENGAVSYSFLGISSRPIDLDLIEEFSLPDNIRGIAVLEATPGYPAGDAGVNTIGTQSVDVITAIDGRPMHDFDEMIGYLAINTIPGQVVNLTVYRGGQILNLPVTLIARPGS